jgi:hypothetical protein
MVKSGSSQTLERPDTSETSGNEGIRVSAVDSERPGSRQGTISNLGGNWVNEVAREDQIGIWYGFEKA